MQQVRELVRTAARAEAHVLIEDETGTGKEVVARAVHALGRRAAGPFVPVNGTVSHRSATGSKSPYESPLAVAIHAMLSRMC